MNIDEKIKGLACMIQESYLESLDGLSDNEFDAVIGSLVRAFFTGEKQRDRFNDGSFNVLLKNVYIGLETQLFNSRTKAIAGREGGKKRSEQQATKDAYKGATKQAAKDADLQAILLAMDDSSKGATNPNININRNINRECEYSAPAHVEVSEFFTSRGSTEQAASRFYRHYSAQGWKRGNGNPIVNWQPLAEQWMAEDGVSKPKQSVTHSVAFCPECHEETNPIAPNSPVFRCEKCQITWKVEVAS